MALLNQLRFETKQKSKYKVDLNFVSISINKKYFENILNFLVKIREPIKTRAIMYSLFNFMER